MMRDLWREDKKGVSLMVGYVLLIVIAMALAVAVFAYLKLYLPPEEPKCQVDVSISIEELNCSSERIDISLMNRGLFNIDGAFIRIGNVSRIVKTTLSEPDVHRFIGDPSGDSILNPGESWSVTYDPNDFDSYGAIGVQELEVEPFVFIGAKTALCEKAVVSRRVNCG